MSQTLVPNGTPVNFGFTSDGSNQGIADAGAILSGWLLQSADYETGADKEDIRSLQGDIVSRNWYDIHRKANMRLFITGAGRAAAIVATTLTGLTPGVILSITKCASHPDLVATNWEIVGSAKITGDITKCAEITLPLEKRAGITTSQAA
jgi:ethanolamine ammonia-lyase large subunit